MPSASAATPVGVALVGCGVVGSGVVNILRDRSIYLSERCGVALSLRHLVVRDTAKTRGKLPEGVKVSTDVAAALADPQVGIVVELIGGTTHAYDVVAAALKAKKRVVTANKALLAARGSELVTLARANGVSIAFEAACAGGIPIIGAMLNGLAANRIEAIMGIANGTCNFILTKMTREGSTYSDALKEAQAAGFAEADPTMDVSGRDTAQKLALLASLAFNACLTEADMSIEGIDTLDAVDIRLAGELGYVFKLLAVARRAGQAISLAVHPTLVPKTHVLADVSGSFNAISVYGDAVGHTLFYGRGAGSMPTASAVVADIVATATGVTDAAFNKLSIFPADAPKPALLPTSETASRFYLRLTALDQPGVLAAVTKVLGDCAISIASFLQHESGDRQAVPLIITTHLAVESAVHTAVMRIDRLPQITGKTVPYRILEEPAEYASV